MSRFVGRLKVLLPNRSKETVSIGLENTAFRGTQLKNTDFVYGCAIYTGADTKMSQNSRSTANKFSSVEVKMNKYLLFFLLIVFLEVLVSTLLDFYTGIDRPNLDDNQVPWYLNTRARDGKFLDVMVDALVFWQLHSYIIPISLYVTLEFQKFFGSLFLVWDIQLYDEVTNQPAKCNSSDLNEELGQVEYLFSDKTGTLTENVMVFKKCSIDSVLFEDQNENLICEHSNVNQNSVKKFLQVLALCHTVQVAPKRSTKSTKNLKKSLKRPDEIVYNASSPDEKAIVEACRNYGVTFLGEKEIDGKIFSKIFINQEGTGKNFQYERLQVLEFDSNRKRMSVIVKEPKGSVRILF